MAINGKNGVTLWIFGAIVFPILFFMGKGVVDNDRASRQRDDDIRKEAIMQERYTNEQLTEIKDEQSTKFTEILVAIERLKVR